MTELGSVGDSVVEEKLAAVGWEGRARVRHYRDGSASGSAGVHLEGPRPLLRGQGHSAPLIQGNAGLLGFEPIPSCGFQSAIIESR